MTHIEGTEGQTPSEQPIPPIEIDITPDTPADRVDRTLLDGTRTIFVRGEIRIVIHPPGSQAAESSVTGTETAKGSLTQESTPKRVTDRYDGPDKPSWEKFKSDLDEIPEIENNKYVLVGNPAKIFGYWVTKKSNRQIADFALATHPDDKTTEFWWIRAFDEEAETVRDELRVGQKDVEVTVYGPDYRTGSKKRKGKSEETIIKHFRGGHINIPERYRKESGTAPNQQKD